MPKNQPSAPTSPAAEAALPPFVVCAPHSVSVRPTRTAQPPVDSASLPAAIASGIGSARVEVMVLRGQVLPPWVPRKDLEHLFRAGLIEPLGALPPGFGARPTAVPTVTPPAAPPVWQPGARYRVIAPALVVPGCADLLLRGATLPRDVRFDLIDHWLARGLIEPKAPAAAG